MEIYHLYKSNNLKKKFMVKFINPNTGKINTIHFTLLIKMKKEKKDIYCVI